MKKKTKLFDEFSISSIPLDITPDKERLANIKLLQLLHQQEQLQKQLNEPIPFSKTLLYSIKIPIPTIPNYKPIKATVTFLTKQQAYQREYYKTYYPKKKALLSQQRKEIYQKNKEERKRKAKIYYQKNKEQIMQAHKKYRNIKKS